MSFQAQNWAVAQVIKNRSKFLLVMLANHADPDTGHCWPSIELLMRETCYSRSSIYSFLAALRRNGYISMRKSRTHGRSHDFWLHFDRVEAPWIEAADNNPCDETQDVDASPPSGFPNDPEDSKTRTPGIQDTESPPYIDSEPLLSEPSVREAVPTAEPQPQALVDQPRWIRDSKPNGFDPNARKAEQARLQAADEAREPKGPHFAFEGSKAYLAWKTHKEQTLGRSWNLLTTAIIDGKHRRGWWFPTLFPPKSTGPPPSPLMTAADQEELAKGI